MEISGGISGGGACVVLGDGEGVAMRTHLYEN